ncbi:MotE family protein [Gracilibacillus alcaliphilus]|uniref:MotE family protein n=1 Tax=Gracilibacillus alcaliphilus TaxID=1401441 RepID=UPI00195D54D0|nr:hypothetical protein [Gracilibacillus alcaliphilus]MBM7677936.1 flagellar motility protein MotE (MotC chaperone) [Gracilibacillus alcaliphilus]
MAKKSSTNTEKKPGVLQWLIVIIVPLLFAIIITVIILAVMGVDVAKHTKEALNKVPFIQELVTTDEEAYYENQITQRDRSIEQLETKVEELEAELGAREDTITGLEEEVATLSTETVELNGSEETEEEQEEDQHIKELSKSFLSMKPKEAAPIIENLADDIALPLLNMLDSETRGKIFAQMDVEVAANYASLLASQE